MVQLINQASQHKAAKAAGITFLVLLVSGMYANFFVDPQLYVDGNAAETARRMLASPALFRTGIASELIMFNCDVVLAIAFYVLLKSVNKNLALLGAFWRFANACIGSVGVVNKLHALQIAGGGSYLAALTAKQLHAVMMLYLDNNSSLVCLIFFSLGMAVHGYLLYRSKYIPQLLSGFYVFAALVIFTGCFVLLIFPGAESIVSPAYVIPDFFAELFVALWLLIKGVKIESSEVILR